jgi:hypothetical protein
MDLRDAMLMILAESAAHPGLAKLAQSAHDQIARDGQVDYRVLSDLIGEASGKGVLRAHRHGSHFRPEIPSSARAALTTDHEVSVTASLARMRPASGGTPISA